MNKKNILISTVSVWNNKSGADTFSNLFKNYDANNIANIYFKSGIPTSKTANTYFNISESKLIKSIFNRKIDIGEKVQLENENVISDEKEENKRYSFWSKHRLWIVLILRELLWIFGNWKSKNLINFINEFKPDIMIIPLEQYMYFNKINKWILKKCGCELYCFLWDDNFTYKQKPFNIFYLIHRFFLRKQLKSIVKKSKKVFTICDLMKEECDKFFNIDSTIITKSIKNEIDIEYMENIQPYHIVYTGNLNIGRIDSLKLLIKCVKEINDKYDENKFVIDVYSQTSLTKQDMNFLNSYNCCNYYGGISQDLVGEVQRKSNILLVLESLTGKERYVSRLSFSTKITDYLKYKKCIFVICLNNTSTYDYFKKRDCGLISTNKKEILNNLENICSNNDLLKTYSERAFDVGKKEHNERNIENKLFSNLGI